LALPWGGAVSLRLFSVRRYCPQNETIHSIFPKGDHFEGNKIADSNILSVSPLGGLSYDLQSYGEDKKENQFFIGRGLPRLCGLGYQCGGASGAISWVLIN